MLLLRYTTGPPYRAHVRIFTTSYTVPEGKPGKIFIQVLRDNNGLESGYQPIPHRCMQHRSL